MRRKTLAKLYKWVLRLFLVGYQVTVPCEKFQIVHHENDQIDNISEL